MSRTSAGKRFVIALGLAAVGALLVGTGGFASDIKTVMMQDQCDPATFNEAVGPGTCTSSHPGVTFEHFIHELTLTQRAGGWDFAPRVVRLNEDQMFQAHNGGGEVHTFTEVDEFGGGFIPELNALTGDTPTPECAAIGEKVASNDFSDLLPPGANSDPENEEKGTHHYQCCIHPWMHTDVVVK